MKVKDCMCKNIVWAKPNDSVYDVVNQMNEIHIGCVPVCDENNKVVGIVTDRDVVLRCIACDKDSKQTPVSDIMTTNVYTVNSEDNVSNAIEKMNNWKVRRIPVEAEGMLEGIVTLGDLAKDPDISDTTVGNTAKNICLGKENMA